MRAFTSFWSAEGHLRRCRLVVASLLTLVLAAAILARADASRDEVLARAVYVGQVGSFIEREGEITSHRAKELPCEPRIATVEWVPYKSPLTENPARFGGGKRIFPGARQPGLKAHEFRKVLVRVQIRPPAAGVPIFLRAFDVDDSSGLFATGRGGDNQNTLARPTDPVLNIGMLEGFVPNRPVVLKTNDQGSVTIGFLVTMQPGDNFKVVASTNRALIQRLVVKGQQIRDSLTGNVLAEARARHPEGDEAVTTELLTVWRRLHVEVDSMPGRSIMNGPGVGEHVEHTDLERGAMGDENATAPLLEAPPMGVERQQATPFSLMQTSDDPRKNLYAPAYIWPVYDLPSSRVKFDANVERREHPVQIFANQDYESTPDFWVVYLQGAYQGVAFERVVQGEAVWAMGDAVPRSGTESAGEVKWMVELGRTVGAIKSDDSLIRISGSTIYMRTIREIERRLGLPCLEATVVHESGHQFGLLDGTGGIMERCSAKMERRFTPAQLKMIRSRPHPQDN